MTVPARYALVFLMYHAISCALVQLLFHTEKVYSLQIAKLLAFYKGLIKNAPTVVN